MKKDKKKKEFRFFWEDPMEEMQNMGRRFSGMMKDFWEPFGEAMNPKAGMSENEKEIGIRIELPGFKKDEVLVSIDNGLLTIQAEKRESDEQEQDDYFSRSFSSSSFSKSVSLPEEVDEENAEAKLENGILEIRLKKLHPEKKKGKEIKIK